ncbi:SWIM zinc finger family protein [Actinosynnema mirum]|uniref:Zinc finger SWIM domain protein n=1 Tax=Actinosynnema mirum (strain ATCC 29888 / DSM 43827 / JCM 3225 / NBRC 14064 / NCIMB 13271 / NRRL B-12336 / IMRU 3971 / 101) TaxID=446462 RepID=C6WE89_ACTMD|nr:SWIM zinc finger family protein [Actinosynnema mirum]ACU35832.1 zinc finger SWIM domain protein [Actinosynnema mirum DSM 43827]
MRRADLLALTSEALVDLANRGLVKRATREVEAGAGPELGVADDGAVTGVFPDGVTAVLPPGAGLDAASCSCGARGACRHRIAVVLAYQREHGGAEEEVFEPWSPGSVPDAELVAAFGERAVAAARRVLRSGVPVVLRRASAGDPVAVAELPSATVRFLVPGELGYASTDAAALRRDQLVALAVLAFREADEQGFVDPVVRFDAGGSAGPGGSGDGPDPLAEALELTGQLLREGAVHTGPVLDAALERSRRDLTAAGMHWPAAAVGELAEQLAAYRARGARHRVERVAELVAEVRARARATGPRSTVLGFDEAAETPMRRVRLTSLGCRVTGTGEDRTAEVFFADGDGVLVLRHRWQLGADERPTGHDLSGRRLSGTTLAALAAANVVSESAVRSPSRVVRLTASRVAKTSVTPLGSAWTGLRAPVLVRDLAAAGAELAALPPRVVRARVEAEHVRVVEVAAVRSIGYDPGAQRLEAVVADAAGTTALVRATYRSTTPAALDALARALAAGPTHVSGALSRTGGRLVITPFAVLTPDGPVVPDLAGGDVGGLVGGLVVGRDVLAEVLESALSLCAEAAHRGLEHLAATMPGRLAEAEAELRRVGLAKAAELLSAFAAAPGEESWLVAYLRLLVTAEFR